MACYVPQMWKFIPSGPAYHAIVLFRYLIHEKKITQNKRLKIAKMC